MQEVERKKKLNTVPKKSHGGYKREKKKSSSNFGNGMIMGATSPKQKRQ